ncbi:MAG: hydrogenase maturation protease [Coleofasciculaceae cyanobacterium]
MTFELKSCNLRPSTLNILVIGYGNTLRSDDGVGQAVAEAVKTWELPNVNSIAVHQLTPELVEPLASVDLAIFVDAYSANEEQDVQLCPLEPAASGWTIGHSSMPRALLAIALALYNYYPQAWLVAIPAKNFELGDSLSPLAQGGMEQALEVILRLIQAQKPIEVAELGLSL